MAGEQESRTSVVAHTEETISALPPARRERLIAGLAAYYSPGRTIIPLDEYERKRSARPAR